MSFSANEKELSSILIQAKDQLKQIDVEIMEAETSANEIAEDLEKLKESLKDVDRDLTENLQKMAKAEENHNEIKLFYEKLVDNTKNLTTFINRQNAALERTA